MSDHAKELAGKVALITGGAKTRGIGAGIARLFALHGAKIVLADVLDDDGAKTANDIPDTEYIHLDVSSEEAWIDIVDDIMARYGRFDILVNNAGIVRTSRLIKTSLDDWNATLTINQTGVFLGMRTGARAMIKAENGGAIINMSSVAGMRGLFGSTAYGATKWAIRGMTKVAAKELGKFNVRVNSIHPGWINTDFLAEGDNNLEQRTQLAQEAPLGRIGEPKDIAHAALYLASDAGSFITGKEFVIDGGWIE